MNFGQALEALKIGLKVSRSGWNGEGMFIFLVPGRRFTVNLPPMLDAFPAGTELDYHAHIDMKTAQDYVVPWFCTQSDMLAEDWNVVGEDNVSA